MAVVFSPVRGADLYVIQYKFSDEVDFKPNRYEISTQPEIKDYMISMITSCNSSINVRVAAVSSLRTGPFSSLLSIKPPLLSISPHLDLLSMVYSGIPGWLGGSVELTLKYFAAEWPFGLEDLNVTPKMFGAICEKAPINEVPLPKFTQGSRPNTVVARLDADAMYRRCHYRYRAAYVTSRRCQTTSFPSTEESQSIVISCDTVTNSSCAEEVSTSPICGQINNIHYEVTDKMSVSDEPNKEILSLEVTFDPMMREGKLPTLYYKAYYGEAEPCQKTKNNVFDGVKLTRNIKTTTNCLKFDKIRGCLKIKNSVSISGIRYDETYGIIFCAIKDNRNTIALPYIHGKSATKLEVSKVYVSSIANFETETILFTTGTAFLLMMGAIAVWCYINKQKRNNKIYQPKSTQKQKRSSPHSLPKASDNWEIERSNLIVYDGVKLGSGAFGAVYLGKILASNLIQSQMTYK
ncbi:unnamed protein product [Cylicocyclus nassatus]|uniref:Protein kinase domain-containing protein n=1 Tax=Cylicocyclus nassatus TaxID=53992 RepID=A0AA36DVX9_CYLNA|nr:unnamed protein product [Cylicocyclus nassatus]